MDSTLLQDPSLGVLPPKTMFVSMPSLLHGQRQRHELKGSRARKSVHDYVAQYNEDFSSQTLFQGGRFLEVLICKFCSVVVGARTDRIKEHLTSRRHQKAKSEKPESILLSHLQPTVASLSSGKGKKIIVCGNILGEQKQNGSFEGNSNILDTDQKIKIRPTEMIRNVVPSTLFQNQSGIAQNSGTEPQPDTPHNSMEYLKIHWNGFDANMRTMFKKYLDSTDFSDVILWVEEKPIKCHRLILAAASPYFDKLLRGIEGDQRCPQPPIIPLPGFRLSDVQAILEFIYNGEFEIRIKDIQNILEVAGLLEIKCLMQLDQNKMPRVTRAGKRQRNNQTEVGNQMNEDIKPNVEIMEPRNNPPGIEQAPQPHIPITSMNPAGYSNGSSCNTHFNGNGQTDYNYLHPAGMTYNPVGLSRGIAELMSGVWDRQQQVPNLPYTEHSEFRPMH